MQFQTRNILKYQEEVIVGHEEELEKLQGSVSKVCGYRSKLGLDEVSTESGLAKSMDKMATGLSTPTKRAKESDSIDYEKKKS